jgi:hypothetical protein
MYWMQLMPSGARSRLSRYSGIVSQSHLGSMPSTIEA